MEGLMAEARLRGTEVMLAAAVRSAGVTTAMTYSHARTFYRMSFRDFYRTIGVPESQLRSREHQLRRMVGYLDGRLYYRGRDAIKLAETATLEQIAELLWQAEPSEELFAQPAARHRKLALAGNANPLVPFQIALPN